ncbi:MAG: response regulator [Coleofasciculaceae cyanobacterium SM2_3_26]|nr:response regulator [Coleofasciculaceae cyanobacterium SM2_3_26]
MVSFQRAKGSSQQAAFIESDPGDNGFQELKICQKISKPLSGKLPSELDYHYQWKASRNVSLAPSTVMNSSLTDHPITVLLVDDQPAIGEGVRRMLAAETDIQFHYCSDPTQTVRIAREIEPTVILQDLVMPEMDGLLLVRFLKAQDAPTRDIPLIVLSSKEEPTIKAEAFALGANDYLVKLPDTLELVARIRYHSKAYINLLQRNEAYRAMQEYLAKLELEQQKSRKLLLNILPEKIVDRLESGEELIADYFTSASVLFADIVGFTKRSARVEPLELLDTMNAVFSSFDEIVDRYNLEKIKTIGDAYMAVAGLPVPREDHAEAIADMAIDMQTAIRKLNAERDDSLSIRIGIHSGPVVAGIIGTKKFLYDLWGDTVNTASRMESHGLPDRIHITQQTYQLLQHSYLVEERGEIDVKGKGRMHTFFLLGRKTGI